MKNLVLALLGLVLCLPALAQESATLTEVLSGHVIDGKVDYEGIAKERRTELQAFVDSLADADPDKMSKTDQIAFWLDAYNGLVVYQVIEKSAAPDSGRARSKFFRGRRYEVAGRSRTLDDIEHEALLPLANDPRIHFVLVCGARSCPPLRASSFLGTDDLDATLDEAAKNYINDPANVEVDVESKTIVLNKIFDWYKDDFGDVLKFVAQYRPEKDQLLEGDWDIEYRDYDWNLNQAD